MTDLNLTVHQQHVEGDIGRTQLRVVQPSPHTAQELQPTQSVSIITSAKEIMLSLAFVCLFVCQQNNNNNNPFYIAPYGRNFRGAGSRSDQCSVQA